jgi:ribosomal protein S27AE
MSYLLDKNTIFNSSNNQIVLSERVCVRTGQTFSTSLVFLNPALPVQCMRREWYIIQGNQIQRKKQT